jgi:hypothetical protein
MEPPNAIGIGIDRLPARYPPARFQGTREFAECLRFVVNIDQDRARYDEIARPVVYAKRFSSPRAHLNRPFVVKGLTRLEQLGATIIRGFNGNNATARLYLPGERKGQ